MLDNILKNKINIFLIDNYSIDDQELQLQRTRKEFEGDVTLVVFPLLKLSKGNIAEDIGDYLVNNLDEVESFNIVKGFLNLVISNHFWLDQFFEAYKTQNFGFVDVDTDAPTYLVEYSSPNTNKPIHLGHLRNNFLGYSVAQIIKASGKNVKKVQIINDRGIHICKSMLAWINFGNGETPESSGMKGDHLVGKYYVKFD